MSLRAHCTRSISRIARAGRRVRGEAVCSRASPERVHSARTDIPWEIRRRGSLRGHLAHRLGDRPALHSTVLQVRSRCPQTRTHARDCEGLGGLPGLFGVLPAVTFLAAMGTALDALGGSCGTFRSHAGRTRPDGIRHTRCGQLQVNFGAGAGSF